MNNFKITGSLIQAYVFCEKQAWLMSRQITGDQYNEFLAIGKLISEESYKRDKKEILIEGGKIDFVRNNDGTFTLVEVKKSNKFLEAAKMQLLYYMMQLSKKGYKVKGEIRIPVSKKVVSVELDDKNRQKLQSILEKIYQLVNQDNAPDVELSHKCKNCAYFEFCWV